MTDIDYYSQCESGMMALMRTLSDYFENEWQVSNNENDMHRGAPNFLIFRPGRFPTISGPANAGSLVKDFAWNMRADLYVSYTEYEQAWSTFGAVRSAIINLVGSNARFDRTVVIPNVVDATVSGDSDPVYWMENGDQPKPNFILESLRFVVVQRVTFKLAR